MTPDLGIEPGPHWWEIDIIIPLPTVVAHFVSYNGDLAG